MKTPNTIPLYHYTDFNELRWPHGCELVGVEINERSKELSDFRHPNRCIYLLGAEDSGLPAELIDICDHVIEVPTLKSFCLNVAVAGSIIMHDRFEKRRSAAV